MPARRTGPAPKGYMWLEDTAERLGITPSTLRKWRTRDYGPAGFKHAGYVIYEEAEVEAHFERCKAADRHTNPSLRPLHNRPIRPALGSAA